MILLSLTGYSYVAYCCLGHKIRQDKPNVRGCCIFIKKVTQHECFPANFAKFLKASFSTEHLRGLLLLKIFFITYSFLLFHQNFLQKDK